MRFNAPFHGLLHAIDTPSGCLCYDPHHFAGSSAGAGSRMPAIPWTATSLDLGYALTGGPTLHLVSNLAALIGCQRPSLAWLSFSVSAAAYFLSGPKRLGDSVLCSKAFLGTFFAAASYELWSTCGRVLWPLKIPNKIAHRSQSSFPPTKLPTAWRVPRQPRKAKPSSRSHPHHGC